MINTLRLLLTLDCTRHCDYCSNRQLGKVERDGLPANMLSNLEDLRGFDAVCLTGGEPMLDAELVIGVARYIKLRLAPTKVYLYSSYYKDERDMEWAMSWADGLTYTLHKNSTIDDLMRFHRLQNLIPNGTFESRLRIHPEFPFPLYLKCSSWDNIQTLELKQPCPLPANETLAIWKPALAVALR